MNELPDGWAMAKLAEITSDAAQHIPAQDELFTYIDIGSIDRETKRIATPQVLLGKDAPSRARKKVVKGDTLVSMTRPNLNAVAQVSAELEGQIASTGFDVLRPLNGIDPRWLSYLVRTEDFVSAMTDLVQGALYPAVRSKDIRSYEAPIAPAKEQTRIVDQLDTLLARVNACNDHLDAIPGILKRFRQAVRCAASSGQLTQDWRDENPQGAREARRELDHIRANQTGKLRVRGEAARVDQKNLFDLPSSWAWVLNYELASDEVNAICAGPFGTIFKAKDFKDDGVPIVFLRHVGEGKFLTHKPGYMDIAVWQDVHQPYSIFGGELLVTKLGDPPGTACIYPDDAGTAMVTPDVLKMTVNGAAADAKYLMHFFNSSNSKRIIEDLCFGVTRLRIDIAMFKTFPIPLPPRAEQIEIVRRVEAFFAVADRIETRYTAMRAHAQRLAPQVLAKAFRGELVEQDPQDEPASVLLQRLAATASTKAPSTRGRPRAQPVVPLTSPAPQAPAPIDWHTLPNNDWAAPAAAQDQAITACLTAVLKAWGQPMPELEARLATLLCQQPRMLTTVLPAAQAKQWVRLVGEEAKPLPAQVARLQPASNSPWGQVIKRMRARGDLVEAGSADGTTWSLGQGASAIITTGWPDGRAAFVVAHLRAHGVASILPTLAPADQAFVHVRAA
jgi:type I restriction enzyme S subunit